MEFFDVDSAHICDKKYIAGVNAVRKDRRSSSRTIDRIVLGSCSHPLCNQPLLGPLFFRIEYLWIPVKLEIISPDSIGSLRIHELGGMKHA